MSLIGFGIEKRGCPDAACLPEELGVNFPGRGLSSVILERDHGIKTKISKGPQNQKPSSLMRNRRVPERALNRICRCSSSSARGSPSVHQTPRRRRPHRLPRTACRPPAARGHPAPRPPAAALTPAHCSAPSAPECEPRSRGQAAAVAAVPAYSTQERHASGKHRPSR